MAIRGIVAVVIVSSIFSCAYRSVDNLFNLPEGDHRRELYRDLTIDDFGRHVFGNRIYDEPRNTGEKYHIVLVDQQDGKMLNSYQIENVPYNRKINYRKSLKIVYRWTGKGYISGLQLARDITGHSVTNVESAVLLVGLAGVSVVLGTAGGFVVGIADASWKELRKPMVSTAALITEYTVYRYDAKGRLYQMIQYAPANEPEELVATTYYYRGDQSFPFRYIVDSRPDKKKHVIDVRKGFLNSSQP